MKASGAHNFRSSAKGSFVKLEHLYFRVTKLLLRAKDCVLRIFVFIFLYFAVTSWPAYAAANSVCAESLAVMDVLVLNSFHPGHSWGDKLWQRIIAEIDDKAPAADLRIRLRNEFLDSERHVASSLEKAQLAYFSSKYGNTKFGAILATDNDALQFMLAHGDALFPGVPVIFCGIADLPERVYGKRSQYTGVLESFSIDRILEALPRVHPQARRLALVSGDTTSARTSLHQSVRALDAIRNRFEIINLVALPVEEMKAALRALPRDTILLNFGYYRTRDGQSFSIQESLRLLREWTDLPMYSPWSGQLGQGVLAGQCEFNEFHGVSAAQMVLDVLQGVSPADLPLLHEPESYLIFDYPMLQHYGIDAQRLPAHSQVTNRPLSFYERHREVLWPATALVLTLFCIITILFYLLRMKQRSERLLRQEAAVQAQARELERRSHFAQRMEAIGRMTGGIAHDVNNILGGVAACAQLALLEIDPENPAHEDITRIVNATRRGKKLMKQIRMTDSTHSPEDQPENVAVHQLLHECAQWMRPQLPPDVTLDVRDICPDSFIRIVPTEAHQILSNLCLNAMQAMADHGGLLRISASVAADDSTDSTPHGTAPHRVVCIAVSDTGRGIQPDLREMIFEPFFTTRQECGGSGLGLAQVHSLLQRNNGGITVKSSPGTGTTFSIFFPLFSEGVALPLTKKEPIASKAPSPRITCAHCILIVEDNADMCYALEQSIRKLGFASWGCADAETALQLLEDDRQFDLIICDQILPGIHGIEFIRRWRERFPATPAILCSGHVGMENRALYAAVAALGNIHLLAKPFELTQMEVVVRQSLHCRADTSGDGDTAWRASL